jgi:hypothetical protein
LRGAALGGYGGHRLANLLVGRPQWEEDEEKWGSVKEAWSPLPWVGPGLKRLGGSALGAGQRLLGRGMPALSRMKPPVSVAPPGLLARAGQGIAAANRAVGGIPGSAVGGLVGYQTADDLAGGAAGT